MVGITVFIDVGDPLTEKLLNELDLAHAREVVHGSEDVLDLTETDLTVALLRPVQRTGYERLVEYLERKVVVYVCFEVLIRMLDLHVGRVLLCERDHLIEALRKCFCIGKAGDERFELFLHGDVFFVVFIDTVRRKACEVIDLDLRTGSYRKRSGQSEEARAFSGVSVTENCRELRVLKCAGADEISISGAELIRENDLAVLMDHQGVIADIALCPLRIRVEGDRADLVVVAIEYFGLGNDGAEDNVFTKRVNFLSTEHTCVNDAQVFSFGTVVLDLDELCFCCYRELIFLRQDEDRTTDLKAVLKGILDDRSVLRVTAYCLLYGILLCGSGIEDHLAVFYEIELTVGREAVLLRQVVPAGRKDLCIRVGTEASAADAVDRTLRCALQRMVKSDTVTDKKVRVVVRARSRRCKVTDQFAALVELAAPFGGIFNDRGRSRKDLLCFLIRFLADLTVCFRIKTKCSVCSCDQDRFLLIGAYTDICIDFI